MARGDILRAALANRIRTSDATLDVHYPPARPAPALSPAASLLTGPRQPLSLLVAPVVEDRPPVCGIKCLWDDLQRITNQRDRAVYESVGWVEGAHAYVRVLVADTALNPANPYDGTIFDDMAYITHVGRRYRRLQTDPIGNSFSPPYTYALWLHGAANP